MLTEAHCKNATCPPDKARARLADSGGLYLEVSPNGSRRWFWKYRKDGKEGRLALGGYPAVTLKAARQARDEAKAKKADGVDPVQARQVEKLKASVGSGDTFEAVAREWLERKKPGWSATHYERERRNIEKDLLPWLGPRKISGIEPVELLGVVKKVEDRGSLEVAHRVLMTAGGVWAYALATARADRIITQGLTKAMKPHTKKNLPAITDPVELGGPARNIQSSGIVSGHWLARFCTAPLGVSTPGASATAQAPLTCSTSVRWTGDTQAMLM